MMIRIGFFLKSLLQLALDINRTFPTASNSIIARIYAFMYDSALAVGTNRFAELNISACTGLAREVMKRQFAII